MNDDKFLYELKEEMPPEFGKKLYKKLQRQEQQHRSLATLAAALIVAVLGMGVLFARSAAPILSTAQAPLTNLQPITGSNIAQLEVLRTLGNGTAEGAAWSPDGTTIAIAGSRGLFLHNADDLSAEPRQILQAGAQYPAYNPDGSILSVISESAIVQLNPTTGEVLSRIEMSDVRYFDLIYSADGTKLATVSCDSDEEWIIEFVYPCMQNTVRFWDAVSGEALDSLDIGTSYSVALNDDFSLLAWADSVPRIRVRDLNNDTERVLINGPLAAGTNVVAFNGDELYALTPYDARFSVWDTATIFDDSEVLQLNSRDIPDYTGASHLLFLPDGGIVTVVANINSTRIEVRDVEGNTLQTMPYPAFEIVDVMLSPDKTRLIVIPSDSAIVEWDVTSGEQLSVVRRYNTYFGEAAFSGDHQAFAAISGYNTISVWDLDENTEQLIEIEQVTDSVISIALNPDGSQLAYTLMPSFRDVADNNTPYSTWVYDLATGEAQQVLETPHMRAEINSVLSFTPDGSLVAIINESILRLNPDGTSTYGIIGDYAAMTFGNYYTSILSSDGSKLAMIICLNPRAEASCTSQVIRVWDTTTGELVYELVDDEEDKVTTIINFSADSSVLAAYACSIEALANGASTYYACEDVAISFWDLTAEPTDTALEPFGVIYESSESPRIHIAFSPVNEGDSLGFLRWASPNQVRAWDVNRSTGDITLLGTLDMNHTNWLYAPIFSPDGQLLAVRSAGSVQLFGVPEE